MSNSLVVHNGEIVTEGDRVWDYDVDGTKVFGTILFDENVPLVHRDDHSEGIDMIILNPLQLHKIKDNEQE